MLKVALLAAALAAAASTPTSTSVVLDPGPPIAAETSCQPSRSLELACALRIADAGSEPTLSPAELAGVDVQPAPAPDWTPLRPPPAAGLDFKEAAVEPMHALTLTLPQDGSSRKLLPALLALGAMVVLLRSRPA